MTQAYPLQWPQGRPRLPASERKQGQFGKMREKRNDVGSWKERGPITVAEALKRLEAELERLGAENTVLSTNLPRRLDGAPRSDRAPDGGDPGVALYFQLRGKPHAMPCDTFNTVADNIAAIAAHIEATRAIERYGVSTVAEMFTGFQALPPPGGTPWWQILKVRETATVDEIESAFRRLARERHPDMPGGSDAMMADLNRARDEALKARSAAQ